MAMPGTAGNWLYAILCVVLPVAWGLLMVAVVQKVEQFMQRRPTQKTTNRQNEPANIRSSPEYHI